jgi:hypothetical protein
MDTKPHALTGEEIKEIAAIEAVREMWGSETEQDFIDLFNDNIYAVKFNYMSGGPGYFGDVIVLVGDGDYSEHVTLTRRNGKLSLA